MNSSNVIKLEQNVTGSVMMVISKGCVRADIQGDIYSKQRSRKFLEVKQRKKNKSRTPPKQDIMNKQQPFDCTITLSP